MFVIVNGESHPLPEPPTLSALLVRLSPRGPFAVAHNEKRMSPLSYMEIDSLVVCYWEPPATYLHASTGSR